VHIEQTAAGSAFCVRDLIDLVEQTVPRLLRRTRWDSTIDTSIIERKDQPPTGVTAALTRSESAG